MNDESRTREWLLKAMREASEQYRHFCEIAGRLDSLARRIECAGERERAPRTLSEHEQRQLVEDALALRTYLDLMLGQNEKLVAFAMGAQEAGWITSGQLDVLMGLHRR